MTVSSNVTGAVSEHRHQGTQCDTVEFDSHEVRILQPYPQIITVLSGCAWITLNEQDVILKTGAQFKLHPGKNRALISSATHDRLVYSVMWQPSARS